MYGNGMNNPFIMSNIPYGNMMGNAPGMGATMMRNSPIMNAAPVMRGASRGGGLSSLLGLGGRGGTGLLAGSRSVNFANILNNTSKALGVVNQAIPIVKEVGPMVGNMKSILKIASVFKDETDNTLRNISNSKKDNNDNVPETTNIKENDTSIASTNINTSSNNEPNFFL